MGVLMLKALFDTLFLVAVYNILDNALAFVTRRLIG